MMLSGDAAAMAAETVRPDDFYRPTHGHIFDAIVSLYRSGEAIDPVTVAEALRRAGLEEATGGRRALLELQANTAAAANADHYARIVTDMAQLRRTIATCTQIIQGANELPDDVASYLDAAEARLFAVGQRRVSDTARTLHEVLTRALDETEGILTENGKDQRSVPTGFADLDDLVAGMPRSGLTVVAGRPSMGKSAFTLQVARNVAVDQGRPVLLVSLEMNHMEVAQRLLCSEARIDSTSLRRGRLNDQEWGRVAHALGVLGGAEVLVDDDVSTTLLGLRAKARRLRASHGDLGLIAVDYLQLISPAHRVESRQQEVADIARGLKVLGRELDVPVLAAAQLNRGPDLRVDKRPGLADLRESGELENSADQVVFLYRDSYYHPDSGDDSAEVIVAKHRNGPVGTARLAFVPQFATFAGLTTATAASAPA